MTAVRKKLAINDLPAIDYYNDKGHWVASIYEMYEGWWSVRTFGPAKQSVTLLSCYHTEEEAFSALCFWRDIPITYLKD